MSPPNAQSVNIDASPFPNTAVTCSDLPNSKEFSPVSVSSTPCSVTFSPVRPTALKGPLDCP